jgi:hypothetical protein
MTTWLNYATEPGELVSIPRVHCKRCHYTAKIRADRAPYECANEKGWIDANGNHHPKCKNPAGWHVWPDDFDPKTCTCKECLIIWEIEQQKLRLMPPIVENKTIEPPPRRRGRPPKYKKS